MRILTRSPALPIPRCTEPSVTVNAHASFGYSIPLADGNYNVTLDFAETYVTAAGQRIFSVSINGTQVLTNFDIYAAAGGMNIAVQRTFPVTVTNGTLSVNFIPGAVENPKINGMEVVESSGSGSGGTSALQITTRSEEHTSELQSRLHLVCRLLLEKKNQKPKSNAHSVQFIHCYLS